MEDKSQKDVIDLRVVFKQLLKKKKLFIIVLSITFVISCVLILFVPRTYTSVVRLAPEAESSAAAGGALSSIASSFGFDIGGVQTSDAIFPMLYPDLFESNDFLVNLFGIQVKSIDGEINTDYYTYLKDYQKKTAWMIPINWLQNRIKKLFEPTPTEYVAGTDKVNPFMLSQEQTRIVEIMKKNVLCGVDMKTSIVEITVIDQDPLICATMADSVRCRLQQFIIDYRTKKARVDVDHYQELVDQAKEEYDAASFAYSRYTDTHKDVILQAYISERDELENEMAMKYNTYTAMQTQLEAAKAKLQEKIPAFTVLQNATVPIKPSGPKRMIFVLGMMLLAFLCTSLFVLKDQILAPFKEQVS